MSLKKLLLLQVGIILAVSLVSGCEANVNPISTVQDTPAVSDNEPQNEQSNQAVILENTAGTDKTEVIYHDPVTENLYLLYPDFDAEIDAMLSDDNQIYAKKIVDQINIIRDALGLQAVETNEHLSLCAYKSATLITEYGKAANESFQEIDSKVIDGTYIDKYLQGKTYYTIRKFAFIPDFSDEQMIYLLDEIFVPENEVVEIGLGIVPSNDGY